MHFYDSYICTAKIQNEAIPSLNIKDKIISNVNLNVPKDTCSPQNNIENVSNSIIESPITDGCTFQNDIENYSNNPTVSPIAVADCTLQNDIEKS